MIWNRERNVSGPSRPSWLDDAAAEAQGLTEDHEAFALAAWVTARDISSGAVDALSPSAKESVMRHMMALVQYTILMLSARRNGLDIDDAHAELQQYAKYIKRREEILSMQTVMSWDAPQ